MSSGDGSSLVSSFPSGTRSGLVLIVLSASLSTVAVLCLLSYIAYSAVKLTPGSSRTWTVSTNVHYYFVNLLISDLVQAIGGVMTVRWMKLNGLVEDRYCTAQGILKQVGDVGVAFTSLAIAIHTFSVLAIRFHAPRSVAIIVIALIWVFIALAVGIAWATYKGQEYYGATQYWCWITEDFPRERIALEYFWMWFSAFGNIILYVLLTFFLKGMISFDNHRVHFHAVGTYFPNEIGGPESDVNGRRSRALAWQLLFYPAVYTITVLPVTVVRWLTFYGHYVPFAATAFASVLFSSSGLLNALLFTLTRPRLLPDHRIRRAQQSSAAGLASSCPHHGRCPTDTTDCEKWPNSPSSPIDSLSPSLLQPVIYIGPSSPRNSTSTETEPPSAS
ncbi:hypothetical protein HGRIS_008054 [Hohenbuehelia grisea]|uniref:Glucose receptor Git3 N-terminal domain-containing protein n=1 Tax=Hohenbuehelia grisea TaxID=104357 RepID=A0ABR3J6S3_9AGAR